MGTAATIRQAYVDRLESEFANGNRLIRHAAPALVEAAEAVLRGEQPDSRVFRDAADGLRGQAGGEEIDTVVLACTHFPLLQDRLADALGPVRFVDGSAGIARRIAVLTEGQAWPGQPQGRAVFTGRAEDACALAPALRRYGLDAIEFL